MNNTADDATTKSGSCAICGSSLTPSITGITVAESDETFCILVCDQCGFGELFPKPEDLGKFYDDYYGGRHGFTARFRAWRRAVKLEGCFNNGTAGKTLLDVGFGEGTFLKYAMDAGWNAVGTERNSQLPESAGIKVFTDLKTVLAEFGNGSFDTITSWHTLEHFEDPRRMLTEARQLLSRDGILLLAVPDFQGFQAKLFGRHWLHLDVPRHLYHFGPDSLKRLLAQCGFEARKTWHQEIEYDIMGWSQSFLNSFLATPDVFFRMLAGRTAGVSKTMRFTNFVLGVVFSALAVPLVLIGSLAGRGGTLVICAVKTGKQEE